MPRVLALTLRAVTALVIADPLGAQSASAREPVDYASGDAWLCRPGRQDACAIDLASTLIAPDGTRRSEAWSADPAAPVDCFYVYPTVSRDSSAQSDLVPGPEERDVVRAQFARFASVCRPFAPMYRQVSLRGLGPLLAERADGRQVLGNGPGYPDVRDAWQHYLKHDNQGRGVVLVGHSQGAMILTQLLRREIEGTPAQSRVLSAILLGTNVAVPRGEDVGGDFRSMPLCRAVGQKGCVISYASFRATLPPPPTSLFGRVREPGMESACTNPAALAGGVGELAGYQSTDGRTVVTPPRAHAWDKGETPIATPFVRLPGLLSAQCMSNERGSYLEVTVRADPADPRADDIPGDLGTPGRPLAEWGLHLVDVDLAIGNLIDIVRAQSAVGAQAAGSQAGIPRTAAGRPDMNGIWQAMTTAYWDLEPHPAQAALALRPGPMGPVPAREVLALGAVASVPMGIGVVVGGAIPYTPEGLAKKRENQANWLARDPEIRCYQPGVPRATYMPFPFQVFQSDRAFFIAYEYAGAVRNIYLTDPGEPQVDTWMGQSVGRWEGDTFVVQSSGFNDASWFDRAGNHHSEGLKVTERYTLTTPYHISYEATMEDPRTFTRPWTIRLTLYKHVDPGARLGQFKCAEFVEELLYGHLRKQPIKP